jgi:hypothetical protein
MHPTVRLRCSAGKPQVPVENPGQNVIRRITDAERKPLADMNAFGPRFPDRGPNYLDISNTSLVAVDCLVQSNIFTIRSSWVRRLSSSSCAASPRSAFFNMTRSM